MNGSANNRWIGLGHYYYICHGHATWPPDRGPVTEEHADEENEREGGPHSATTPISLNAYALGCSSRLGRVKPDKIKGEDEDDRQCPEERATCV